MRCSPVSWYQVVLFNVLKPFCLPLCRAPGWYHLLIAGLRLSFNIITSAVTGPIGASKDGSLMPMTTVEKHIATSFIVPLHVPIEEAVRGEEGVDGLQRPIGGFWVNLGQILERILWDETGKDKTYIRRQ
jgi:hypothetical protein